VNKEEEDVWLSKLDLAFVTLPHKTGRSKSSNLLGGSVLTTVQARVKIHKAIQDRNKTRTGKTPKVV